MNPSPAPHEDDGPKTTRTVRRTIVIALLVALDMGMAHYLSRQASVQAWAVVLALLPMAVVVLGMIRATVGNLACCLVLLGMAGLAFLSLPVLEHHVRWIYFIQNVTVNLFLGLWFGQSLRRGREPLCTAFAGQMHPVMHPLLRWYTTRITQVWTGFFLTMVIVSTTLFFLAPVAIWSAFANLLTLPLVVLVFVVEYAVRKRVLPPEDHLGPLSAFRAYRERTRRHAVAGTSGTKA